jgi:hypothetical protein
VHGYAHNSNKWTDRRYWFTDFDILFIWSCVGPSGAALGPLAFDGAISRGFDGRGAESKLELGNQRIPMACMYCE